MSDWKHDDLQRDLAAHLRGYARPAMVWTNMQLGSAGSPRPDVYTIEPTYTALRAMAYEIKVSRADFLRDAQAGKALGYLNYAGAVVFAAPKGMLSKAEIPAGCGLIERGPDAWRWAKKPTIQPVKTLPFEAWMKLLIDGRERDEGAGLAIRAREANEWVQRDRARKLLGDELGRLLADRNNARYALENEIRELQEETSRTHAHVEVRRQRAEMQAQQHVAAIREQVADIVRELGLPPDAHAHEVIAALRAMRPNAQHDRDARLARELQWVRSRVDALVGELSPKAEEGEG